MARLGVLMLCLRISVVSAAPVVLEPHEVGSVRISTPRGWDFTGDAATGIAIARQDPKKKDSAQLVVVVSPTSNVTEDQVIDTIMSQVAKSVKVVTRGAGPGGAGKLVVADGAVDGFQVRLATIAFASDGGLVVGMLVAKTSAFNLLGGTDLIASVLASLRATTPAAGPAPAATPVGKEPFMQPEYNSVGGLFIPFPKRSITIPDLAGEWSCNNGAARAYASGGLQSGVASGEQWSIDARGGFKQRFKAAVMNSGGMRGVDEKSTGRLYFDQAGELVVAYDNKKPAYYLVRGWFYGKDGTILKLNGPYYDPIPAKYIADPNYNEYMNQLFYRKI